METALVHHGCFVHVHMLALMNALASDLHIVSLQLPQLQKPTHSCMQKLHLMISMLASVASVGFSCSVTVGSGEFVDCKAKLKAIGNRQGNGCKVKRDTMIAVDITVALAAIYFAATYVLLILKLRSYRRQSYTSVQVGIVYNTLQVPLLFRVSLASYT